MDGSDSLRVRLPAVLHTPHQVLFMQRGLCFAYCPDTYRQTHTPHHRHAHITYSMCAARKQMKSADSDHSHMSTLARLPANLQPVVHAKTVTALQRLKLQDEGDKWSTHSCPSNLQPISPVKSPGTPGSSVTLNPLYCLGDMVSERKEKRERERAHCNTISTQRSGTNKHSTNCLLMPASISHTGALLRAKICL